MKKKFAVIGGGIGGMAAAISLRNQGYEVTVFEKNRYLGGKMGQIQMQGYRFDLGPSVFTMPGLVDELFEAAGEAPRAYYRYDPLSQSCQYFYEDGTLIRAFGEVEDFARELAAKTGEPQSHIHRFLEKSRTIYELTADLFMFHSIHEPAAMLKRGNLKPLLNFRKIDAFRTMHQANSRHFNSSKLVQLFDRYATYNGSDPYRIPATFNIITHLEHNMGVFYPEGGIHAVVEALQRLMDKTGIRVHRQEPVEKLLPGKDRIQGLQTPQGRYDFDGFVSNMDVNLFYDQLLKEERTLKKLRKPEKSTSALIFYWGVDGSFPDLSLHNILFAKNYRQEFDYLFKQGSISPDPTVYIYISSRVVEGDAPRGKENWYVMVNAPEDTGQDWARLRAEARTNVVAKIQRMLGIQVDRHIECEKILDPPSIGAYTTSYHGSLYGNSSNGKFAAFNRHANFSRRYHNLYFTGGSVHPGGGIPLALASARIVSDKIRKDDKTRQRRKARK